jgi:hypothetical protein
MASSKKKKSSKKPAAKATKKKAAPASKKAAAKKKAPAPKKAKAAPKKKPAAKAKPAVKAKAKPPAKKKAAPMAGDSWGNAALAPKVAASTPPSKMTEPSDNPVHALHDHEGTLVSPVDDEEEIAERLHGGQEAVKDEDADGDSGSGRLDDRDDDEE